MNENLINQNLEQKVKKAKAKPQAQASNKPEGIPEQFWDEAKGEIKLQELLADYARLASKDDNLIDINNRNIPESFDKYDLKMPHPLLEKDDDIFKRFYDCGFSNEQAQLVYDLANEKIIPVIEELTVNFEAQKQLENLIKYFGSQEKFNEVSIQISKWAKENVSKEVYDALATTAEGVIALYKMMSSNEPLIGKERTDAEDLNEDKLKQMMKDPRYWRDRDKDYITKISNGFKKLYPDQ